jgi:hypothetical protein
MKKNLILAIIALFLIPAITVAQLPGGLNKLKNVEKPKTDKPEVQDTKVPETKTPVNTDKGIVSDFHKTHFDQILFCEATQPDVAASQEFITSFDYKDDITGCVYLKPIAAYSRKIMVKMFLNEELVASFNDQLTDYTSAFYLRILRKMGSTESSDFTNKILKLPNGDYNIRLEMWGSPDGASTDKEVIAKGEFKITKMYVEPAPTQKYSTMKPGMVNATLEQQAIKLVNEKAAAEGWKEKYTKAKIESTDWGIIKNEYTGNIIKRRIDMVLYGAWPDGKCKMVSFGFEEEYSGGGNYGSLKYTGIGDMTQVICE